MTTHGYLDKAAVSKIGVWENEGKIVGLVTYDCKLGEVFCLTLPEYVHLKKEILLYAKDNLSKDGKFSVVISDTDLEFQNVAARLGFVGTEQKESDAIFQVLISRYFTETEIHDIGLDVLPFRMKQSDMELL